MSKSPTYDIQEIENSNQTILIPDCRKIAKFFVGLWKKDPEKTLNLVLNFINARNPYVRIIVVDFLKHISQMDRNYINNVLEIYKEMANDDHGRVRINGILMSLKFLWNYYPKILMNDIKNTDIKKYSAYKILGLRSLIRFLQGGKYLDWYKKEYKIDKEEYQPLVKFLLNETDLHLTFNETFYNSELIKLIIAIGNIKKEVILPYLEKWARSENTLAHYIIERTLSRNLGRRFGALEKNKKKLLEIIADTKRSLMKSQISLIMDGKYKLDYIKRNFPSIIEYFNMGFYPFYWGINPYKGSEYDFIYSNFRFNHNYFFKDSKTLIKEIVVKTNPIEALKNDLSKKKWKNVKTNILHIGSICDPYQKAEEEYKLTTKILKFLLQIENPICITTSSPLILRDIEILREYANKNILNVMIPLPTLDEELKNKLEVNTSSISKRLEIIKELKKKDIVVGALFYPILPYINDEVEDIQMFFKTLYELKVDFIIPHTINFRYNVRNKIFNFIEINYSEKILKQFNKLYPKDNRDGNIKKSYSKKLMKSIDKLLKDYNFTPEKKILKGIYPVKEIEIPRIEIKKEKCPKCGSEQDFDAKFCPNCGKKL